MVKLSISTRVKEKQDLDPILMQIKDDMGQEIGMAFDIDGDGI